MRNNIKKRIEKRQRRKTNINITIDETLEKALNNYKENHEIEFLSPMINEILWGWLKKEEEDANDK